MSLDLPLRTLPLSLAGMATVAAAQAPPSATVVVTATRTERLEADTAATVTVLGPDDLDRLLVQRPNDLVRFEPGVDVGNKGRQGSTSFDIRGIGGNRVMILVDGVNLPDGPEAGRDFSRDLVDLDSVARVEILRGPASALYGSDALGGVVSYTTRSAQDFLPGPGRYAALKLGYAGASGERSATVTAAGRHGAWDGLILDTVRRGAETAPRLGIPDPMAIRTGNLLAKAGFAPDGHNRCSLDFQRLERTTAIDLLSGTGATPAGPGRTIQVLDDRGDDLSARTQASFAHQFDDDSAWFQHAEARVYFQQARTREVTTERRDPGTGPVLRWSDYRFDQDIIGVRTQAERRFQAGAAAHRLLLGLDASRAWTSQPYDRTQTDLATGAVTRTIAGASYPIKVCADSATWTAGGFAQDEVLSPSGRFSLIPGLRLDAFVLDPRPDADFQRSNVQGAPVRRISSLALSPKLAFLAKLAGWTPYLEYAQGFRNPPYDNTNVAITNRMGGFSYQVLPNPRLGPERSYGLEAGLRGEGRGWDCGIVLYGNRYRNFIQQADLGLDPAGTHLIQYRNLQAVRIFGAEARASRSLGGGLRLQGGAAWSQGDDLGKGLPLDSVAPFKAVAALQYRAAGGAWGADLVGTGVARKTRVPPPGAFQVGSYGAAEPFRAPGYGTLDVLAFAALDGGLRLTAGVFNLLDKAYWHWEDVRGFGASDPALARATQPGRNLAVTVAMAWL